MVYDASCKMCVPSLNECLHPVQSFVEYLSDVLMRSCICKYALIVDIEKAFLQIV